MASPRQKRPPGSTSKGNLFSGLGVVRTLASYLPRMVLERFFKPQKPEQAPEPAVDEDLSEKARRHLDKAAFPAAILFVDVSGFTSLNEKFAREGSGGIEKVTKHINGYFTQLINKIHDHGGDVLKFAGDALIVAFGDRNVEEDLRTYVIRATQCGIEIQRDLRSYDADGIRLTLHIAVGAGTLYTFHLGGINEHWEFFPAGSVFGQISSALDKSQSGQVYLSAPAYELIKDVADCTENTGDYLVNKLNVDIEPKPYKPSVQTIVQAPPTFEEDIRCYIGAGIQKRIDAGQSQWLAEMRRVSVIFVSLKNLSFQKEKAEEEPLVSTEEPSEGAATSAAAKSSEDKVFALATPRVLSSARGLDADVPAVPAPDPPAADAAAPPDAPSPAAVAAEEHHVQEIVPDYRELNEVMRIVQKVIFRHDGFVRQFLVDDKVFGVPTTHPDDPIRAMAAALSIKNQLKGLGLKSYIGVTTGTAFCGTVGSSDRQEYAVVGDIVNLSARLMVASYKGKHGILCDAATNEMAASRFNLQALPPIMVKGKSEPIKIFIPTKKDSKDSRDVVKRTGSSIASRSQASLSVGEIEQRATLQGREAEKALIYEQLESLGSDMSSFAIVCEGIAGIGKTRLGEELADMARAKYGEHVLAIGGGDSIDQETPFLVFAHIVRELYSLTADTKHNEHVIKTAFAKIEDADLRNDCFTYMCLLNEVLHTELAQSAAANKLSTDTKASIDMMHKILLELLVLAAKEHPRVIIIEDAQWIDVHSWDLLSDVVSNTTNLLLFVTTRPVPNLHDGKSDPYSKFSALYNTAVVKLAPLSPEHILRIVRFAYKLTGGTPRSLVASSYLNPFAGIPAEVATLLTNKAQGNPFFAKEIVKGLESQGAIAIENGVIRVLKPLTSVIIPENLKALILSNFDQLNPNQQMVLKVASVLGKVISVDVLDAVFPEDAKKSCSVPDEILKLLSNGVLTENNQTKQKNTYLFSSNLFQEVAYGMMLDSQRIALHQATALYYEKEFQKTDMLGPLFNQIVYHFEHANLPEKAEYYKERMEARKRWQYAYRLVSTVEFWGRKGGFASLPESTATSMDDDDKNGDSQIERTVELEDEAPEETAITSVKINVEVVDQLAQFTPKPKSRSSSSAESSPDTKK